MKKFEDHWREKLNDPNTQNDFLKEEVKADMWEKIQSSKKKFEQAWHKKIDPIEIWEGSLDTDAKQELWDKLQIPLAKFEKQWREKVGATENLNSVFLDEDGKERIAGSVFAEKEAFELQWQDKMNDPAFTDQDVLDAGQKEKIWHNIASGKGTITQPREERRKPLFALRWSHAAALLIGALSTWLIWNQTNTPLQNTVIVATPEQPSQPATKSGEQVLPSREAHHFAQLHQEPKENDVEQVPVSKEKAPVKGKEERKVIERVATKVTQVAPVKSELVLVKTEPKSNTNNTEAMQPINDGTVTPEKEIEKNIAKAAPKKVVHISDIRPSETITAKGTAIYARAFGDKERPREKNSMTLNSVFKNYK